MPPRGRKDSPAPDGLQPTTDPEPDRNPTRTAYRGDVTLPADRFISQGQVEDLRITGRVGNPLNPREDFVLDDQSGVITVAPRIRPAAPVDPDAEA